MIDRSCVMHDECAVACSREYSAISEHYLGKFANRSGAPYIQHIDEGLRILEALGSSLTARLAYCLHPLAQSDSDLAKFDARLASTPEVLLATIEYRNVANRYLSHHYGDTSRSAILSPVQDVNDMLIADKVQNRKDFEKYHLGTHKNSSRLSLYFKEWLEALGVDEKEYIYLAKVSGGDS